MNKIALCLMMLVVVFGSCNKSEKPPLHYFVSNDVNDNAVADVYIPSTGTYDMKVKVKFLSGYQEDKVKLVLTGLPAGVTVAADTFNAVPTYVADFVLTTNSIALGSYPVTLTAYTPTAAPQSYNFNLVVIPPDCAAIFWGNLTGSSACTARNYTHTASGSSGGQNILVVNNFGGYGTNCNVKVRFVCSNDSVYIDYGNYGNGVVMQGQGVFNGNTMVIDYTASSIPGGGSESCTITYTK